MRILVCGGRDYQDYETFKKAMGAFLPGDHLLIHGDYTGADAMAKRYAREDHGQNEIADEPYPADWDKHDRAAGPIRNQRMLDEGEPHFVVAFPGNKGTNDMVTRAKRAGLVVFRVES